MSNKKSSRTLSLALGTAFATGLAASNVASASEASNPFGMNELSSGYMQLADNHKNDKTRDKKGKSEQEGKCGEGKCGEGKCGAQQQKEMQQQKEKTKQEGKCGEGRG